MGLDVTHDCWHGAYSAFMRFRATLCEVAGYGNIRERDGFGGSRPWPEDDVLVELLTHSDCDGEIPTGLCTPLADRLTELLPALERAGNGGGHIGDYAEKTRQFISGLRLAAQRGESVEFH